MYSLNISFVEQKKDLRCHFKEIERFLKNEDSLKFDDLITFILKSIKIIYSNPEKLLYHLSADLKNEDIMLNYSFNSEISEIPILSKEFKKTTQNKLLKDAIKIIYRSLKFLKTSRFNSFSNNQKYIYMHLIRHLLKECLFEMPMNFKNMFSKIFQIDLKYYSTIENFYILRSLLLEIGDYEIIKHDLEKEHNNNMAKGFIYYIKALKTNEIVFPQNFDEIFEVYFFLLPFLDIFHQRNK